MRCFSQRYSPALATQDIQVCVKIRMFGCLTGHFLLATHRFLNSCLNAVLRHSRGMRRAGSSLRQSVEFD